ncbi:MAG: leucine-rich repeat protein [Lachnospiraceae bacterium]|nr:leucine-rich repeat protein [Lachnospiraceae bacterium]
MKRSMKKKMRKALGVSMAVAMTMTSMPEGKLYDWRNLRVQAADTTKTIDASAVVQQIESVASNRPGIPDGILLNELKKLVNTKLGRAADHEITFSELMAYDGEIDLSAIGGQITSISGLGYARKAKKIILTNVPVKVIDDFEFDGCTGLQEIVLPANLESIGKASFRNCNSLETIILPETMKTIGESAFDACTKLAKINLPNTIEKLDKGAFGACKILEEITITNPKIVLGASVFESCENLKTVNLPEGITEIPASFLAQTGITSIKVPSTVKIIKQSAFNLTLNLKEIDLTGCNGLTTIESSAFAQSGIETIKLPNSLTTIKSNCFDTCVGLKEITIPDSVQGKGDGTGTGIETLAFWRCYNLKKISLPAGISALQKELFNDCWNLQEVEIRNSATSVLESIEAEAFVGCNSLSDTNFLRDLPNLKRIEDGAFSYRKYKSNEDNLKFAVITGIPCKLDNDIFNEEQYSLGLHSITLPNSVTYLGKEVFEAQPNVEEVTLGSGLKTIPENTFKGFSYLKKLILPSELKTIGNSAFNGCCRLEDFTFPNTLETIGNEAFSNCGAVKTTQKLYYNVSYVANDGIYDTRPAGSTSVKECLVYQTDNSGNQEIVVKYFETSKCITENAYKKVDNPEGYTKFVIVAEKKYVKENEIFTDKTSSSNSYTNYTYDTEMKRIVNSRTLYTDKKNDVFAEANSVYTPIEGYTGFYVRGSGTQIQEYVNTGITNLNLPNSVKTIGKSAFYNCYNLQNITISDQVIEIPESAFALDKGDLLRNNNWIDKDYESGAYLFYRTVTLPKELEVIGDKAFENNTNLKNITSGLPQTLLTIGKSSFKCCCSLESIVIPSKVKSIGEYGFWGCSEYAKSKLPGTGKFDEYNMAEKYGLQEIDLTQASSLESIGARAFGLTAIRQCTLPEKVTEVQQGLFEYCEFLNKVICSNDTNAIQNDVFRDCVNLVSITIPAKATVSYYAFRGNDIGMFNFSVTDPEPYSISIGENEVLPINTFLNDYLRSKPEIKEKNGETGFLEGVEGKIEKINNWNVHKVGVKGLKEGITTVSIVGTNNYLLYGTTVITKAPEINITLNITKKKCTDIIDEQSSAVISMENTQEEVSLNPQVLPADCSETNVWSSSNENIVSILPKTYIQNGVEVVSSSAVLYPRGLGTSKVTLKTGSVKKDYQVHVVVPATGITLDKQEISAKEGSKERIKLNANMTYDASKYSVTDWENFKDVLEYQSGDEKIVKVSAEGVVTPVGVGTTQITVTALGSGKTAVCNVRVLPDETLVYFTDAAGTAWDTTKSLEVQAKEPIILNIGTEPVNSIAELTWEFSDKNMFTYVKNTTKYVETEDKGQQEKVVSMEFTGDKIGTGTITIYPKNCKNKEAVSAKVNVQICADVKEAAFATVSEMQVGTEQTVFGYIVTGAGKAEKVADIQKITTDSVSFISSNSSIASVDSKTGVVKAVGEGKVTISMQIVNPKDSSKNMVKNLELNIVRPQATDMIVTEKNGKNVVSVGGTLQLVTSLIPNTAKDTITFVSENPTVASVDANGKITGLSAGTGKITVKAEKKGITKTFEFTVTGTVATNKPQTSNPPQTTNKPQTTTKPSRITVSKVTGVKAVNKKGKKIKVSWKKLGSVKGYRITVALNKKFTSGKKTLWVKKGTITSKIVSKLKKSKTYYVKVEAYKLNGKKKVFGKPSAVKKVKIKK